MPKDAENGFPINIKHNLSFYSMIELILLRKNKAVSTRAFRLAQSVKCLSRCVRTRVQVPSTHISQDILSHRYYIQILLSYSIIYQMSEVAPHICNSGAGEGITERSLGLVGCYINQISLANESCLKKYVGE